ncbi:MAG: fibro-slime domain-containing protein [Ruminococcaceae bacterium]|nr:fibro-slime domain-containing protein [Oscillospiraceae bacterium]
MIKLFCKRTLSLLLILCTLLGILPASSFAALRTSRAGSARASTDLTSTISGLKAPIAQSNTYLEVTNSNKGALNGTYFLVNQASDGTLNVMKPLSGSASGNLSGVTVTKSGSSLVGADLSYAIDVVMNGSELYLRNRDGKYIISEALNNEPCLNLSATTAMSYGLGISGTSNPVFYRFLTVNSVRSRYDLMYDSTDAFHWIKNVGGYYPASHVTYFYKIAQRWSTTELYNAIQSMKSYASANNGRYAEGIHTAFMECMEASINLYNQYNVATGSQTYEQIVAIRSELEAQTQWLLSYKDIMQASYADAASALPTPRGRIVPISWREYDIDKAKVYDGEYYYIANISADGKSAKALDLTGRYYSDPLECFGVVDATVVGEEIFGVHPNTAIKLEVGAYATWLHMHPLHGLDPALNGLSDDESYCNLGYGDSLDMTITFEDNRITMAVHPYDLDGDGEKEYHYLTYLSEINGFRYTLNRDKVSTADNLFTLFKVSEQSIELYKTITKLSRYATGNADERYPADVYASFITCLTESIKLYQQYNVTLNTTDAANYTQIKKDMDDKAAELEAYTATLTRADTITEYIDIPVEIYDFRADTLFFEYMNGYYNMGSASAPGSGSSHGRLGLTEQTLTSERKIAYTEAVVDYIVNAFYQSPVTDLLSDAPGWNDALHKLMPSVAGDAQMPKGSYDETIAKTSTGENGGDFAWADVDDYYDLAYYLLTYLWRPVDPADIMDTSDNLPYNVKVADRDRLRLYADENGDYILDVANEVVYDGYYIYNSNPRISTPKELDSPYFEPIDHLGFETDEMLEALGGDTDRGKERYEAASFDTENTNFHFTMHAKGSFVYYEDQNLYFDFVGDDDVYFFIDGKMALDIGGAHQALGERIELNDLDATHTLIDGEVYDFDMFYAERHTTASNLKFSTNIKIVDTDTVTTMDQYAQTLKGESVASQNYGLGAKLIDNAPLAVDDLTAYSFNLLNTREVPIYNLSFTSPTLGTNISGSSLTLYKATQTNGAVTNISDIVVLYHSVEVGETNVIDTSTPISKSVSDMKTLLGTHINANTALAAGSYMVKIATEQELMDLLTLGIPHGCQISVYGFKRYTIKNDTPYTNTVISSCNYQRAANNEGSQGGEVFTVSGSASRILRVISDLPKVEAQQMVLDYGKPVAVPVDDISYCITTDAFVKVTGFAGVMLTGENNGFLKNTPANMYCRNNGDTVATEHGIFKRTADGLVFQLTDFLDAIETVYLAYAISGCETSDLDGNVYSYPYVLVELELLPANAVYYETDFSDTAFDTTGNDTYLFFDFNNTIEDQQRYSGKVYGYQNFDTEENAYWATRSTRTTAAPATDFVLDNESGTLSIAVATDKPHNDTANYGPWLATTDQYGSYPKQDGTNNPLNYIPNNADYIQIRFKVEGCSSTRSAGPRIVAVYDYMKDGTYPGVLFEGRDYTMVKEYTYKEGVYQVLTLPVSDNFKNADLVTTFGFRFWDLKSTNDGKITVDYIYVGPEEHLPQQSVLLNFDSTDTSSWTAKNNVTLTKDTANGVLSGTITGSDPHINMSYTTDEYNYVLKKDDVVKVRIKVDSGTGSNIQAFFGIEGNTGYVGGVSTSVTSFTPDGNYQNITMAVPDSLIGKTLWGIRIDLVHKFEKEGAYEIDYIYVGPEADYLYFGFDNSDLDQARYAHPAYGCFNFDLANWATGATAGSNAYTMNHAEGNVSITVTDRTSDYGPYFSTTNKSGSYPWSSGAAYAPLSYPVSADTVLKVRFKVSGCTVVSDTVSKVTLLLHNTNSTGGKQYCTSLSKEYTYKEDEYQTLTFNFSNAFSGTEFLNTVGMRFNNIDGTSNGIVTIDYIYVGSNEDFAKALAENNQLWQTISDGTTQGEMQDSESFTGFASSQSLATGEATTSTVSEAETSSTAKTATRASSTYTPPSDMTLNKKSDQTIMEGVTETSLSLTHDGNPLAVYATTINADAQATMKVSYAGYYSASSTEASREALNGNLTWATMRTTKHAANYENATGNTVLFAMNGGFPKNGATRGPLVMEGNLIQPFLSTIKDEPMFAVMKDGSYAILDYTDDFSNVEEALGLRQWLVKDGVNFAATYTEADEEDNLIFPTHPRTAIGIKADGSVVCVVVDGRQADYSTLGVTLNDLAELMISLGCVSAANMDGGGSSTFASRYDESEDLTIRNSPSDDAGERSVITALLMISTENECQHDYSSGNYAISDDGRHNLICDICRQGIDSPHRYENGVCVCGKQEEASPNLFFDFTDNPDDRDRYMTSAYGYRNFDRAQYVNWWQSYWATKATSSQENLYGDFKVNELTGTLVVNVADGGGTDGTATGGKPYGDNYNWGPWVSTAYAYRENPDRYYPNTTLPLNYDPSQAEIVKVRFKVTGCSLAPNVTNPRVVVICDYNEGTNIRRDTEYDMVQTYSYVDGEYVTLTFELCDHLKNADSIRSFGFRFWDIYSTLPQSDANRGTVTIDYIYVGTRADAPVTDDYFFVDFTNTKADQERYANHTYGGTNLDLSKNWTPYAFTNLSVSNGILSFTAPEGFGGYGVLNVGTARTSKPLNYVPNTDDYYQIRFRIDDATSSDLRIKGTGRIVLFYSSDPASSNEQNFVYYDFKVKDEIIDRGWVTLTFKLSDMIYNKDGMKYEDMDVINAFTPCFNWIVSAENKTATYQIDYLYVGPEETLPSFGKTVYGYDTSFENDSMLSNGSSLFIEGAGIPKYASDKTPIYEPGQKQTAISFTFTGTGFDIISRTGANQGLIRVSIYDENGTHVKTAQVLNRSETGLELYQIPVLSIQDLKHGTYTAKIFVAAAYDYDDDNDPTNGDNFNGLLDRGGEFCFDAIRIYDPIDITATTTDAATAYEVYQGDGEANAQHKEVRNMLITAGNFNADSTSMEGVVYLDAKSDNNKSPLLNYTEVGPNNEVYLSADKAVAFKLEVTGTIPASIDIGAKSANGAPAAMVMAVSTSTPTPNPTGDTITVSSSTSQYYPLNILPSKWETENGKNFVYVTIYNNGAGGILSITDIKYAYDIPATTATEAAVVTTSSEEATPTTRSVRFLVDSEMIDALSICAEHNYSYVSDGDTHRATCSICSYCITEAHSYTDGTCICGASEEVTATEELDKNLTFTMNISAGAEMSVSYTIMANAVNRYADFYLEITKNVANGEAITTIYGNGEGREVMTEKLDPTTGEALMYQVTYKGINAKEMGDNFSTTLYAVGEDGTIYYGSTVVKSIKSYLIDKIDAEASSAELRTMCVDMLKYGAAAQLRLSYNTDNLVTADLTEEQLSYATQEIPEAVNYAASAGEGASVNTNITVTSRVQLNLSCVYTTATNPNAIRCVITDSKGNVLAEISATKKDNIMFSAIYENVGAKEMRDVINATFYEGETVISKTISWSVESYVAQVRAKTNVAEDELNMVNAMLTYGDAVAAYMKSIAQ